MSWKCDICGKKPSVGYRVSHSTRHTKHIWKPNLQAARVLINGVATRIKACTTCIKSGRVKRA